MYFTNWKWNVIYSETHSHAFIQGIQRITSLGQGCLLPQAARNMEWITSFHWPHCTNSPAAFPQTSSDEKVQTRNHYCPHCPNTGRNPVLLLWPLAELPPTLTTARLVALLYSQKLVSVKQRRNNWFLGTVCCNFASCATQQVVQAWGGHTSDQEKRVLQIFTLPPAHLTALHLCCVLKHIRGSCQAPQSSLKWQNLIL